jgi:acyl carrier protein
MNDIQTRVSQCFANVFPGVAPSDLPSASVETLARWDSVAHVTLLSAIGEEFSLDISPDDFDELTSYKSIVEFVENHAH